MFTSSPWAYNPTSTISQFNSSGPRVTMGTIVAPQAPVMGTGSVVVQQGPLAGYPGIVPATAPLTTLAPVYPTPVGRSPLPVPLSQQRVEAPTNSVHRTNVAEAHGVFSATPAARVAEANFMRKMEESMPNLISDSKKAQEPPKRMPRPKSRAVTPKSRATLRGNAWRGKGSSKRLGKSVPKGENQELTGRVEDWKKTKAEIEALQTRFIDEVEAREAGHHTCQELKRLIESQHTAIGHLQDRILSTQHRTSKLQETSAVIADAIIALQGRLPTVSLKSVEETTSPADQIDRAILEYIDTHPEFTISVKKTGPGVYIIGNRRMRLTTRGDMTVVRIGGGYYTLEEYFDGYWKSDCQAHQTISGSLAAMSTSTWMAPSGSLSARISGNTPR